MKKQKLATVQFVNGGPMDGGCLTLDLAACRHLQVFEYTPAATGFRHIYNLFLNAEKPALVYLKCLPPEKKRG